MNTALTGAQGFLTRFEALQGRLPGDSNMRAAAAVAFRAAGLPGGTRQQRPLEAWKYTSLRPVAEASFDPDAAPRHEAETILAGLSLPDAPRLVFVDGHFRADLSGRPVPSIISQDALAACEKDDASARTSKQASAAQATKASLDFAPFAERADMGTLTWPDREPMVALNTMLATDGACLHVPAGADAGLVQLVSIATRDTDIHPRHSIVLDPGARLTLLEVSAGQGAYLLNTVAEFHVAAGAHLTHIRAQNEDATAFHVSTCYAEIAGDGTYDSFTLNLGSRLCRTEIHAELTGRGAIAHLNAAQLLDHGQHADFTTVVRHTAPAGTSRQTVKNVLSGASRGVFQGRIEVAREAQKTDGYQMNQALLLSPRAEIDSKPELEIFADDVKCSHGATVGELDAEQIFYLRSRGIPEPEARSILVRAFLAEALDAVADETIRAWLDATVETWWRQTR